MTPLIVFQARTGAETRETSRLRTDEGGLAFYILFLKHLETASHGNPDEVIVKFLRPVPE